MNNIKEINKLLLKRALLDKKLAAMAKEGMKLRDELLEENERYLNIGIVPETKEELLIRAEKFETDINNIVESIYDLEEVIQQDENFILSEIYNLN